MTKNKKATQATFDLEIEDVKKTFLVTQPNLEQQREGQKVYNRAFSDAVQSGALIRAKLDNFMRKQEIWDDDKQKEFSELQNKILKSEQKLAKGGFKLSEAKALSLELRRFRDQLRDLIAVRSELDVHTAEGQADNQRFNYWVSQCLVYNDTKKPVYGDLDSYLKASTEETAIQGAQSLARLVYGLSDDYESKLPENQFLKEFDFVDDKLRLINDDGKLVDETGHLINDDGYYIDDKGNLVDVEGNPLDKDGNYAFERQPFLNEEGKPLEPKLKKENPQLEKSK